MDTTIENQASAKTPATNNNGFISLLFNIVIPVLILNKLSSQLGAMPALILGLIFPLGYGLWDYIKHRQTNFISVLGFLNVSITGGLALYQLTGIWFAVKEAAFPLLIGIFVFASAFRKKPFIETLFMNPNVMQVDKILTRLKEQGAEINFHKHLRQATMLLSASFLLSSYLNFVLAHRIFINIDTNLEAEAQAQILNQQIAEMTYKSMLVITVPSMICLLGVLWYLIHGIRQHTGLKMDEVFNQ